MGRLARRAGAGAGAVAAGRLPLRDEIVLVTFFVVAFSIVVQGLTMPPVLRRLGFLGERHEQPDDL